jgi:diketogulonate reductase-like aldo/keto reductase
MEYLLLQSLSETQAAQTTTDDHMHENLRAIDVQLTPADLREIETALSKNRTARWPDE